MKLLAWDKKFETSIEAVDKQHMVFFDLLNELNDLNKSGSAKESILTILDKLIDYANYHFSEEEKYMELSKYPGMQPHLFEHENFKDQVVAWKESFLNEKGDSESHKLMMDVLIFLKDWLTDHIKSTDMGYVPYVKKQLNGK